MKIHGIGVAVLAAACCALLARENAPSILPYRSITGCKPSGPVVIESLRAERRNGVLDVSYRVSPAIDVRSLRTTWLLPAGGEVQSDRGLALHDVPAGSSYDGAARIRSAGDRVGLKVDVEFVAASGDAAILERAAAVHYWSAESVAEPDLPLVERAGATPTLDVPAVRYGGDAR